MLRIRIRTSCLVLFWGVTLGVWSVHAQAMLDYLKRISPLASAKHPKISPMILHHLNVQEGLMSPEGALIGPEGGLAIDIGGMDTNEQGLQVYIELNELGQEILEQLKTSGVTIEIVESIRKLLQARIPLDRLEQVSRFPFVKFIRLPDHGYPNRQGSVGTEGDAVIRADAVRQNLGVTGAGIRVGVITDGISGLSQSMASGDLPAGGAVSLSFRADGNLNAGAEGTALLEIVHDIAPGAQLFFANFGTSLEFIQAVDWLADEAGGPNPRRGTPGGVDIIVQDVVFFNNGPYDGSCPVSQALTTAVAREVAVFSAVGNRADIHYQGLFTDTDGDTIHEFDVSLGRPRVDVAGETLDVTLQPGETITIFLQWNDPFGASGNNYDLCVGPSTPPICSTVVQDGDDDPTELLLVRNGGPTPITIEVVISNFEGRAAPRDLEVFILFSNGGTMDEFVVPESSVPNAADAVGAISVGAVNWRTPETIEPFSSRGPTNDGRLKPELVAPDEVSVTGAGGFPTPFFGTSASVPHVGAVAALVLSANPTLTPAQLAARMMAASVPLGTPTPNNTFGSGLVDALTALSPTLTLGPTLSPGLNQTTFRTGQTLIVGLGVQNTGPAFTADLYFSVLLPDQLTVLFFTPTNVVGSRLDADPRTFQPFAANVPLPEGVALIIDNFQLVTFTGGEPSGTYSFVAFLTPPGAFVNGLIDSGEILALGIQPFSFSP
jgi:subtilisin family serine protease